MSKHDPTGETGQPTSPPRAPRGARSARPATTVTQPSMSMIRCAMCNAPNVTDREICWRCLRDLSDPSAEPESRDMTHVVEAALGREPSLAPLPPPAQSAGPVPERPSVPVAVTATAVAAASATPAAATRAAAASEPVRQTPVRPAHVAPVLGPPDLTPIKVTPLRRESPAILPMSWPPPGSAQRGRRRVRSVLAGSLAALLTFAIAGVVLVGGWLPGTTDPDGQTGPITAGVVEASPAPTSIPTAAPAVDVTAAPAAEETAAADPVDEVDEAGPAPTPKPTSEPRATAAPDPVVAADVAAPEAIEASTSGMRATRAANAFVCQGDAAPIRDPYDRTWGVTKVSFSTQGAYERVILHLRRIGEARPGRSTAAIAGRVPTSKIGDFPEDVRPEKKQRRLLRVDLAGVPDGPDLRAFRLLGLGQIGELSLLPAKNGRTALLAVDGDACYRVRVPAWGPEGLPDANAAEVIIDVRSP